MTTKEIRQKYLEFFAEKSHQVISSASLIPENDPTVLFTTAGMHPLVPYLLGEKHPAGNRLTNAQKCIRTGDIDEVGDKTHHTFFEMMGNWSLGDYFKEESLKYSWEFLTDEKYLGLDKNRLAVSVFEGDDDAPFDEEAYNIWKKIFEENNLPIERIARLPKKNNWWGPAGVTGPCGPDSEIFYWTGDVKEIPSSFNDDNDFWVEIWNNVFMQYNKNIEGKFETLEQKNVDTGLGLERTSAVINGLGDNYKTDLFINLIKKIEDLSGHKYEENDDITRSMRIVADHLKAATFIIGDPRGITPSNTDQGYVVRRLIRRAVRYGLQLGIKSNKWISQIAEVVISEYQDIYPELKNNYSFIIENLDKEEEKFSKTLEKGLRILNNQISAHTKKAGEAVVIQKIGFIDGVHDFTPHEVDGKWLFDIYQSFGFPLELSMEEIKKMRPDEYLDEEKIKLDFMSELKKHQDLSRTSAAGKFKGGLADQSEATTKLHTTAHLLLESLRRVLGDHVEQRGSNITAERLRFDFSHNEKMSDEQKKEVEDLVNNAISQNYDVKYEEMSLEEAKAMGANGVFESRYGERVKVYSVGDFSGNSGVVFSKEICGGPHVENLANLGHFVIQKEESSSSGVRRIKAILEPLDNNNK